MDPGCATGGTKIDYDNPQRVTETGPSWSGEYSQTSPFPAAR